jgi:acyl phosphate:glycerol-3-phosphate acyltransferase
VTTTFVLTWIGLVVLGYLFGSISPSVFLGKLFKGLDVRQHGSGNAGTTNAFRVLGTKLGIAVLICDILKGVLPVLAARFILGDNDNTPLATVIVALACIAGHDYSIFLRGKGGKGVATGAGAALAMMPLGMAFVISLFVVLLLTVRIVSVASIASTIVFPVSAVVLNQPLPYVVICCLMSAVVLWAHRANFKRLWHRSESRVIFPWNKKAKRAAACAEGRTEPQ